jgi:DNA polymerase
MQNQGRIVPDWGDISARLVLVGEAPGTNEERLGQPFVGSSGNKLAEWWQWAGLNRGMFYITNVYPYRPPDNDITKIPKAELDYWIAQLKIRLSRLLDPFIIIPAGAVALKALYRASNITNLRGSMLNYEDESRIVKMIPVIHPTEVMRRTEFEARCVYDWMRIGYESKTRGINLPKRNHRIAPSLDECHQYTEQFLSDTRPVAVDIETHPAEGITCVGFSTHSLESFTIPLGVKRVIKQEGRKSPEAKELELKRANDRISAAVYSENDPLEAHYTKKRELNAIARWQTQRKPLKVICKLVEEWETRNGLTVASWESEQGYFITVGYWATEAENEKARQIIRDLVAGGNPKIFHNGFYDVYWLRDWLGAEVNNWHWDTLAMHHCLVPNEEHTLDFLASVYTREPFWKKESKEAEGSIKQTKKREALWLYNGKDVAVTFELFEAFLKMLQESGRLDFYWKHYYALFEPLMDMSLTGIKVDLEIRKQKKQEYLDELNQTLDEVDHAAGKSLRGKTALSGARVKAYLYEDLKLPRQKRYRAAKGEKTDTSDELAIRTLILRYPDKLGIIGEKILRCQRLVKILGYLKEKKLDADGRLRSQYKFNTTTGRLASGTNPYGSGDNAQNVDGDLKGIYVAG